MSMVLSCNGYVFRPVKADERDYTTYSKGPALDCFEWTLTIKHVVNDKIFILEEYNPRKWMVYDVKATRRYTLEIDRDCSLSKLQKSASKYHSYKVVSGLATLVTAALLAGRIWRWTERGHLSYYIAASLLSAVVTRYFAVKNREACFHLVNTLATLVKYVDYQSQTEIKIEKAELLCKPADYGV